MARFFLDHGTIHDRLTGKHVTTDGQPPFEDSVEQVCELLNGLIITPAQGAQVTPIYQIMETSDDHGMGADLWMDVTEATYNDLKTSPDMRSRIVYASQPPAAPVETKSAPAAVRESVDSTPRPPASAAMGHSAGAGPRSSAGTEHQLKPPFDIYHDGMQIGDAEGHICSAENPEIAKAILSALNNAQPQRSAGTNDLPQRLRHIAGQLIYGTVKDGDISTSLLCAAADEIDRLRAQPQPPSKPRCALYPECQCPELNACSVTRPQHSPQEK